MANSELACVYAALILADDDVAVTPKVACVDIEPCLPGLFSMALESADLNVWITNGGSSVDTAPTAGGATPAATAAALADAEVPKKKESNEEGEEKDNDMDNVMGLGKFK